MAEIDLSARLKGVSVATQEQNPVNVGYVNPNPVRGAVCAYQEVRNQDIINAIAALGMGQNSIMQPDKLELAYVNSVFQNKGYHSIDNVTYDLVNKIADAEFDDLNKKLQVFTKAMGGIDTSGIFGLIDDLSKEVQATDLKGIWEKAVNHKPSLLVRFIALFNPHYLRTVKNNNLQKMQVLLTSKSGTLEVKLTTIQQDLEKHQRTQKSNLETLRKAFDVYFHAFVQLRKQFALVVYLEHSYKGQLEAFKQANSSVINDLKIDNRLKEYERVLSLIENKRLILWKSMLQLKTTSEQNQNLTTVVEVLLQDLENTIKHSFPSIRSNLVNVGISIQTQKAMLGANSTKELDANLALLASETTADLAIKGATLASESRLREANTMKILVDNLTVLTGSLQTAKQQSQQNIEQSTAVLRDCSVQMNLLSQNQSQT